MDKKEDIWLIDENQSNQSINQSNQSNQSIAKVAGALKQRKYGTVHTMRNPVLLVQ